jgi:hypothetical protein
MAILLSRNVAATAASAMSADGDSEAMADARLDLNSNLWRKRRD